MSATHKAALAEGRSQGRDVRLYLEALEKNRPRRGRKRTQQSMSRRLADIEQQLDAAEPLTKLRLLQERISLESELAKLDASDQLAELQGRFVRIAKAFGDRKGISYAAWRECGVPADVLRAAGITNSS